jgi:molecular chaperone DnaJ
VLGSRSGKGDQHIRIKVTVPKKLTAEQSEKLRELAKELGLDIAPKKKGLLGSLFG